MKPLACYNCGAPRRPKCEYCGTEYEAPPAFIPEIELARQQQAMSQGALAKMQNQAYSQMIGQRRDDIRFLSSILGGLRF